MRITTKGQVTIPLNIREKFGFLPHVDVEFVEKNGVVILRKVENKTRRGRSVIEHLRGRGSVRMSTDQILELTRGKK